MGVRLAWYGAGEGERGRDTHEVPSSWLFFPPLSFLPSRGLRAPSAAGRSRDAPSAFAGSEMGSRVRPRDGRVAATEEITRVGTHQSVPPQRSTCRAERGTQRARRGGGRERVTSAPLVCRLGAGGGGTGRARHWCTASSWEDERERRRVTGGRALSLPAQTVRAVSRQNPITSRPCARSDAVLRTVHALCAAAGPIVQSITRLESSMSG